MRKLTLALILLATVACSDGGDTVVADLVDSGCGSNCPDVDKDAADPADQTGTVDLATDLSPSETLDFGATDLGPDTPFVECDPGEGCFLDPCTDNSQCQSGWCLEHMGDGVCTQLCQEECPPGWSCQAVGTGPDVTFVCVSRVSNLCKPCTTGADCKSPGGADDVCVDYDDEGAFCGGACTADGDCPWGFSCLAATTVEGVELKQCVADAGVCPCTAKSVSLGLSTPCEAGNEHGLCKGKRYCSQDGLTDCDAPEPMAEMCNGLDDNCDGDIDEETCDDDNACTQDSCAGDEGCQHQPLTGTECIDGNPCTVADLCNDGVCAGTPVACDDDNVCTDDTCDETGGCVFTPNHAKCDDANPCTVADACEEGECVGFAVDCDCLTDADCGALEDGDLCNGTLFCNTALTPHKCEVEEGTPVTCPLPTGIDAPCLKAGCEPATGECSLVPVNDDFACDDGDLCTLGDACSSGTCQSGQPLNCDDANPCTDDACDGEDGCVHLYNLAQCDDKNACTAGDVCTNGQCVGGEAVDCDDDNPCTKDACSPLAGCSHVITSGPCDDGDPCTVNDACVNGECAPGAAVVCDDNNVCTDDACQGGLCTFVANDAACDDGNACTGGDHCQGGKCITSGLVSCDDNNVCTTDSCAPETGCLHTSNALACNDGDPCTVNDMCADGACVSGSAVVCDDGNPCTDDACQDGLCQFVPNDAACDDGNACTVGDHCSAGKCVKSGLASCDDDNVCTTDSCDPDSGCLHLLNTAPCDDGNLCTTKDACHLGECVGSGTLTCSDGNPCTDDACVAEVGCTFTPNTAPCDDNNACTTVDACAGGACVGAQPPNCSDDNVCTDDLCDAAQGCVNINNSSPCTDFNACTEGDQCLNGECIPGAFITCNDNNLCTDDSCVAETGCVFIPNTDPCNDNDACTKNDVCGAGECDGDSVQCDDGKVCTNDTCDAEIGCVYSVIPDCCGNGIKEAGEECDDGNNVSDDGCSATCQSENTSGCADGSADQVFQQNVMVGCDGAWLGPQIANACGPGWHPANANEYFSYGGKTTQVSVIRWVDTAWNSQGKDVPLAQWQGYYDCSNGAGWDGICHNDNCTWVSHTSQCYLTFANHDYGQSWGCHCRGGNPNSSPHGVICVNDNNAKPRL